MMNEILSAAGRDNASNSLSAYCPSTCGRQA
jgi:hypothetical protein